MFKKLFAQSSGNQRRSLALSLGLAIVAVLAVSGSATAAVLLYTNDFSSRGEVKQVKKFNGGKACNASWRKKKAFEVTVKRGVKTCVYRTRVINDGPGGDLDLKVDSKHTNATQKAVRRQSFSGLGVRYGKKDGYLFKVYPNKGKWDLSRKPNSGAFPVKGTESKIKPVGKRNVLRLRVKGSKVTAWVNGTKVVNELVDGNAGAVDGTKSVMVIGNGKSSKKDVVGFFDNLKVKLP